MREKIKIIENLGKIDKKPIGGLSFCHYEIQKIEYKGKTFFRRQKIHSNLVTSCSYADNFNAKSWESSLNKFVKTL